MLLMLFFPVWGGSEVMFYPFYLKSSGPDVYHPYFFVAILGIASFTVSLIEITKFKNRMLQIKLGALNSLLMAAAMVIALILARRLEMEYQGTYGIALFMPAVAMISNSIANRFIRRDEKLVKESDRLR